MRRWNRTLVVMALLCLFALNACSKQAAPEASSPDAGTAQTAAPTESTPAEISSQDGGEETVTYFSDDGSIVRIDRTANSSLSVPPSAPELSDGNVFQKWDSVPTTEDGSTEIHPEYLTVTDMKNVFALPGAYGRCDETVVLPLRLCGIVRLCAFDLRIEYDPDALSLESVFYEDGAVIYNAETPGVLYVNYISIKNTEADVDVLWMKFRVLAEEGELPIHLSMTSIYAWDENEKMVTPEYTLVDSTIYICQ